ncbi:hypothetical protein LY71_10792 [Geodermatophilus tzadiensis]|uniref:Uncharacterized protein n=1 Tax=Geodermatophilus tzadiensis TaxID=1137988 RepID=A0A2T0TTN5_9ACTN|nr:hypothetical protein [Geodermatophilus tzadiensis]PRY49010.1 hypothetical protein LY71_10792 [Geodermatophilus tzadiensis]
MNTYDPADYVCYVPMDRRLEPFDPTAPGGPTAQRLPRGYANASPATRLRSRTAARAGSDPRRRPAPAAVC